MNNTCDTQTHESTAIRNAEGWAHKPVLQEIYGGFYRRMSSHLNRNIPGAVVEIGSGIGSIRDYVPDCIRTDIFPGLHIDRVENIYRLGFADATVSNLLMLDVFHHLRYPGAALNECRRVLTPGGRIILLEPCISLLGAFVYGCAHPEPVAFFRPIEWLPPIHCDPHPKEFYAAQGNATRIFTFRRHRAQIAEWNLCLVERLAELGYILSGGYSRPQYFPDRALPWLRRMEKAFGLCPALFATRLLVVLEKGR